MPERELTIAPYHCSDCMPTRFFLPCSPVQCHSNGCVCVCVCPMNRSANSIFYICSVCMCCRRIKFKQMQRREWNCSAQMVPYEGLRERKNERDLALLGVAGVLTRVPMRASSHLLPVSPSLPLSLYRRLSIDYNSTLLCVSIHMASAVHATWIMFDLDIYFFPSHIHFARDNKHCTECKKKKINRQKAHTFTEKQKKMHRSESKVEFQTHLSTSVTGLLAVCIF